MSDEIVATQEEEVVATAVEVPASEPEIDVSPETTPEIEAEKARLAQVKEEADREEKRAQEAKEKAEYWRREKVKARGEFFKPEEKPPQREDVTSGKAPNKDDFDDYDQYMEAKIAFEVNRQRTKWEKDQAEKGPIEQYQKKMLDFREKVVNEGVAHYPDFEDVALDVTVPITPLVAELLTESEIPTDVLYYLGKNRTEAIKLSRMTPVQAVKEITRIEGIVKQTITQNQPIKKVTSAPAPIKPVGSGTAGIEKDPEKMSQKEFEAWRESMGARRF